ncbi:MAG: DUF4395 domain-containing protein [Chitinophagaceae bacterium]|nr:DUF4395 domain-containing protein [Chitinophagaceae bacterium]
MNNEQLKRFYTDKTTVRLTAFFVFITTGIAVATHNYWLAWLLSFDFALRAFTYFPSPLGLAVKSVRSAIPWNQQPVFAAPKKFAAGIGFVMALTLSALLFFSATIAAYSIGSILLTCALLESAFSICVGCYVYDIVVAPLANKRNTSNYSSPR